jgi:murein DD-endopeptidase MepM/ murein hydrolase activator NlpD
MRRRWFTFAIFGFVAGLVSVIVVIKAGPVSRHPFVAWRLASTRPSAQLPVPVMGVRPRDLRDTWDGPRSGGRRHRGIDIFAKRGTPIRSATPGIIVTVGTNRLGGRIVRVFGPGGEWHYYAHLERYAEIRTGQVVAAGTILGYVGDSGNARGTPPHLHYGIYRLLGGAMNPYGRLTGVPASSQ